MTDTDGPESVCYNEIWMYLVESTSIILIHVKVKGSLDKVVLRKLKPRRFAIIFRYGLFNSGNCGGGTVMP